VPRIPGKANGNARKGMLILGTIVKKPLAQKRNLTIGREGGFFQG